MWWPVAWGAMTLRIGAHRVKEADGHRGPPDQASLPGPHRPDRAQAAAGPDSAGPAIHALRVPPRRIAGYPPPPHGFTITITTISTSSRVGTSFRMRQ